METFWLSLCAFFHDMQRGMEYAAEQERQRRLPPRPMTDEDRRVLKLLTRPLYIGREYRRQVAEQPAHKCDVR